MDAGGAWIACESHLSPKKKLIHRLNGSNIEREAKIPSVRNDDHFFNIPLNSMLRAIVKGSER
jgi:hypothetical protein